VSVIDVDLAERSYQVHVGQGVRGLLPEVVPDGVGRVVVITQEAVPWTVDPGVEHIRIVVPPGEAAKAVSTVESVCRRLAEWGCSRADMIVAVGGGVVTDLGGFVAAVYHRGIRFIAVPTTLLGQVDAAIGGKTGVNLPEGKNLVGAFWQPSAVLCDTETLSTLPEREMRSGTGEVAKYQFLGAGDLDRLDLDARVAACVRFKADVVAADERESGRRAILNYGHTLAHAIETAGSYDLRHGEAVAVGLVYAAEVAYRLGRIDTARVAEHYRVIEAWGLPSRVPDMLDDEELVDLFSRDKKAVADTTLVLDGPHGVETVVGIDPDVLIDALGALR